MKSSLVRSYPPVVVGSVASVSALREAEHLGAAAGCDWLELRVDGLLQELSPEELQSIRSPWPILLTVRDSREGGLYDFSSVKERARLAHQLLPLASAVDWEVEYMKEAPELIAAAKSAGVPVIASAHDFQQTPDFSLLQEKERYARELGADIVKFAFRLQRAEDMLVGVELLRQRSGPMAVMGMGELGAVSRLLYAQHGSCLVYGYIGDAPTAPGQWSAHQFRRALARLSLVRA